MGGGLDNVKRIGMHLREGHRPKEGRDDYRACEGQGEHQNVDGDRQHSVLREPMLVFTTEGMLEMMADW